MTDARLIVRRAVHELSRNDGTQLAASMTFYAVLAFFPAMIAVVSIISLIAQNTAVVETVGKTLAETTPAGIADVLGAPITAFLRNNLAGYALLIGIAGSLWSASNYVGAFGRGVNRIYGVQEGRASLTQVLVRLGVTGVIIVAVATTCAVGVLLSPLGLHLEENLGISGGLAFVWNSLAAIVFLVLACLVVAFLYTFTSNVRVRFRPFTAGSIIAIVFWVLVSGGFFAYVSAFGNYDAVYGTLAGLVIFLLWLYLGSLALIFGVHIDQEVMRMRQLRNNVEAEYYPQLELRGTSNLTRKSVQLANDVRASRKMRKKKASRD